MESVIADSKNKKSWNMERTNSFVQDYLAIECLWNTDSHDYKSKNVREQAYQVLSDKFDLTVNETKTKIRILRTTFKQEQNKVISNPDYTPKLSWFHTMLMAFHQGRVKSFHKGSVFNNSSRNSSANESIKSERKRIKLEEPNKEIILYKEEQEHDDDNIYEETLHETHIEHVLEEHEIDQEQEPEQDEEVEVLLDNSQDNSNAIKEQEIVDEENYFILENETENDTDYHQHHHSETELEEKPENDSSSDNRSFFESNKPLSSNQFYLMSLCETFDRLPKEKNIRARIKIMEILYKIEHDLEV